MKLEQARKMMIRWGVVYAGSEMGTVDAATYAGARRMAYDRWGGTRRLYAIRQIIYLDYVPRGARYRRLRRVTMSESQSD